MSHREEEEDSEALLTATSDDSTADLEHPINQDEDEVPTDRYVSRDGYL